jgi:hypothetical protein
LVNCCIGTAISPANIARPPKSISALRYLSEEESKNARLDLDEMLGDWKEVFTGEVTNSDCVLEAEADFSKPRVVGQASKRRKT